jgi:hypothetical protein
LLCFCFFETGTHPSFERNRIRSGACVPQIQPSSVGGTHYSPESSGESCNSCGRN